MATQSSLFLIGYPPRSAAGGRPVAGTGELELAKGAAGARTITVDENRRASGIDNGAGNVSEANCDEGNMKGVRRDGAGERVSGACSWLFYEGEPRSGAQHDGVVARDS